MIEARIPTFFIGCVKSSELALKTILKRPELHLRGVMSMQHNKFNADFVDLTSIAVEAGVPIHYADNLDVSALSKILRDLEAEVVFAIGWSKMLDAEVLRIPRHGVIGFHPAALPQNRGRHPLIWSLALGLEMTASTLFLIEKGVDSGPILSQEIVKITPQDDAQQLYNKVLSILPRQIDKVIDDLVLGELKGVPQNHAFANNWRKRSMLDGLIDWRMSATAVRNLTRALTHPYTGAEFAYGDELIKLWRCEIVTEDIPVNAEPGKVLDVDERGPVIKTGMGAEGGAVRLLDTDQCIELHKGDYL